MGRECTLELIEDGGWRWFAMDGPNACRCDGGPFPTAAAAADDAAEVMGDDLAADAVENALKEIEQ